MKKYAFKNVLEALIIITITKNTIISNGKKTGNNLKGPYQDTRFE
jgi:hypothetical protein